MGFNGIVESKVNIDHIPVLVLSPKEDSVHPTVIFYHGWGSDAEKQRFRGGILASLGYQVLIPTGIHHGDRDPVDHTISENAGKYFWKVVFTNIEESYEIIDYAVKNLNADKDRIAVMGNSMGGFTSAGIFARNSDIKAAVIFNGSCDYGYSSHSFADAFNISIDSFPKELMEEIDRYDPVKKVHNILNRPLLMLHGDGDTLVDVKGQRQFFDKVSPMYNEANKINLIEYPKLNHHVTTNMMEEAAIWLEKYI